MKRIHLIQILAHALSNLYISTMCWAGISNLSEIRFQTPLDSNFSPASESKAKLDQFVRGTLAKIPGYIAEGLDPSKKINIQFKTLGHGSIRAPLCLSSSHRELPEPALDITGSQADDNDSYTVFLNVDFLEHIFRGELDSPQYRCGYRSYYRWAQAELIKQIVHIFEGEHDSDLSGSDRWQNLVRRLSPLDEELSSNESSDLLGRYLTYYLLDDDFKCRLPSVHYFFDNLFAKDSKLNPGEVNHRNGRISQKCQLNTIVWSTSSGVKRELRLDRLYQVHLLLANPGSNIESRWGHIMFRLIFCAPERKTVDEQCLSDLNSHIVLSFLGIPGTLMTSTWAGMVGKYPTRLTLEDFSQILNQYTIKEPRGLTSFPLRLSKLELKLFFERALEEYWGYQGRYYFLANNCVTEALNFLNSLLVTRKDALEGELIVDTPVGLKELLESENLIDKTQTKFFGTRADQLKLSSNRINDSSPQASSPKANFLKAVSLNARLELDANSLNSSELVVDLNETPESRMTEFKRLQSKDFSETSKRTLALRFYQRELKIYEIGKQRIQYAMHSILQAEPSKQNSQFRSLLTHIQNSKKMLTPIYRTNPGYGIPLIDELRAESEAKKVETTIDSDFDKIKDVLKSESPELFESLSKTNNNMIYFYSFLKRSNPDQK